MRRTSLFTIVGLLAIVGIAVGLSLPFSTRPSNCGGNSAALACVKQYTLTARIAAMDSPDEIFRVTMVTPEQRKELAFLSHYHWVPEGRFLVSTAPFSEQQSGARRVVIVCDTPYSNVPRRWIGSAPLTHAAGFSDGSTGLISPAQFAALDRSSFRFLDELYPTK